MPIGKPLRWTLGIAAAVVLAVVVLVTLVSVLPGKNRGRIAKPKSEAVATIPIPKAGVVVPPVPDPVAEAVVPPASEPDAAPLWRTITAGGILTPEFEAMLPKIDAIKPLLGVAIPDDPPPHEGAMFDVPYTINPPDILILEVLEALPGRPISGERLVRPDGTVTLGFYGDLYVRGLTVRQVKEKLLMHLRKYLTDEPLGLVGSEIHDGPSSDPESPPKRPVDPFGEPNPGGGPPEAAPKMSLPPGIPHPNAGPAISRSARPAAVVRLVRSAQAKGRQPLQEPRFPVRDATTAKALPAEDNAAPRVPEGQAKVDREYLVQPADSDRVFVDVASYNSTVYFTLGEFQTPGRLPITGREFVLDAIQYAGGLSANADPKSFRLVRPARGGKPERVYPIDLQAIQDRGEVKANLQIFPGDRLVVGRKASAEAQARLNEWTQPSSIVLNHMLSYALAMRAMNNLGELYNPNTPMTMRLKVGNYTVNMNLGPDASTADPAKHKAALKAWAEMLSTEPAVRDEVLKLIK